MVTISGLQNLLHRKKNNKIVINIGQEYKNVDKNFKTCVKTTLKLDEKYEYVSTNLPGDVFSDHKRIKSYLLPIFSNPFSRVSIKVRVNVFRF